jgi:hypothetical protein
MTFKSACYVAVFLCWEQAPVAAHDIYTKLTNASGRSCCDGSECRPARYRVTGSGVEMLINSRWVYIPRGMIQYRTLEGDMGETAGGHWCGEPYEEGFITYCAFLPPNLSSATLPLPASD